MKKTLITISLICLLVIPVYSYAGSSSDANAVAEQSAEAGVYIGDINSNNDGMEKNRYFAPPGEINYPIAPNFLQNQPSETYQTKLKLKDDILEYDEGLTTQEQMNVLDGTGFFDKRRVMVRPRIKVSEVKDEDRLALDEVMPVAFEKVKGMKSIGTITVVSNSKGSITPDVFAEVQVQAWKLGGKVLHVKGEGFQRMVRNEGAGIGFTWSGSVLSAGGEYASTTGVMGAGKSWGNAGLFDHPFIVVHVLVPK